MARCRRAALVLAAITVGCLVSTADIKLAPAGAAYLSGTTRAQPAAPRDAASLRAATQSSPLAEQAAFAKAGQQATTAKWMRASEAAVRLLAVMAAAALVAVAAIPTEPALARGGLHISARALRGTRAASLALLLDAKRKRCVAAPEGTACSRFVEKGQEQAR
eukprot:CAMPEP_0115460808 /NCGR_PEP_ID=MMETSP0271-20121206/46981_1 /TAXON_ID=71861 /ORGANISM="Scrippsiella trochoidea, Strain CCMP3099" /LENGTH=162 /DNA_ID=CAMNT_0002887539 /DNA_START=63 /DNA_END=551 /DNA_ORIENTATION=+